MHQTFVRRHGDDIDLIRRSDRFKYILSSSNEEAFFDLKTDPYEMKNLIADPELKTEIEHHRKSFGTWMMTPLMRFVTDGESVWTGQPGDCRTTAKT